MHYKGQRVRKLQNDQVEVENQMLSQQVKRRSLVLQLEISPQVRVTVRFLLLQFKESNGYLCKLYSEVLSLLSWL